MSSFSAADAVRERLDAFALALEKDRPQFIGFPAALDYDYRELEPFLNCSLNNVGDPYVPPLHTNHSKAMEQEVVEFFGDVFRAPVDDRWGYVTSGGSEGNLYALYIARELHPKAVLFYSDAAHYSVPKAAHILNMKSQVVKADSTGEMQYDDLQQKLQENNSVAAIVVANIGTTMTEARDDVGRINQILDEAGVKQRYIHSDAALAGTYAALISPRHRFDFADGADSVSISGHKFIGSPMPCGVVLVRKSSRDRIARSAAYVGTLDTTISGSRNGHTALILWYAIKRWGIAGFKKRAQQALELASYTVTELQHANWEAWRNPHALTVMLKSPPVVVIHKWQLATYNGWSHVVCMPGLKPQQIDRFVRDLTHSK